VLGPLSKGTWTPRPGVLRHPRWKCTSSDSISHVRRYPHPRENMSCLGNWLRLHRAVAAAGHNGPWKLLLDSGSNHLTVRFISYILFSVLKLAVG